ncbi:RNA pseudouridylate synthase, partial [Phytophthora megakarya]
VIGCISRDGVEYHEGRFGSFNGEAANETVRVMLRDQATCTRGPLDKIVEGTTISAHRPEFLLHAANVIFPEVVTSALCSRCIHHTFAFVADAILMKDMRVGV